MRIRRGSLGAALLPSLGCLLAVHPAPAVEPDEPAVALEEVIVTAEKRAQHYLDVPVAVSSVSGELLGIAKTNTMQELVQVSPSVTFNQTGDMRGVGLLIRGIGTTNFQTTVEPTISAVIDGVPLSNTVQFLSDLSDIERIEVLRGPQGTLFGKNASGGLINVITQRPSKEFEGTIKVNAADDSGRGVQAQVSGPLSDSVRGRLSAYWRTYDGFIDNAFDGTKLNGEKVVGARGKLDIDLSQSVNLLLIADYSKQNRDCCELAPAALAANINTLTPAQAYAASGFAFDYRNIAVNRHNSTVLANTPNFSNTNTYGLSAELNAKFDTFTLTSVTGYRRFNLETQQDADLLPYSVPTYGRLLFLSNGATNGGDQEQAQLSQELRIASTAWDTVDLTAGLFYWKQRTQRYFERQITTCVAPALNPALSVDPALTPCAAGAGFFAYNTNVDHGNNKAAFGQIDKKFATYWTASAGLRYTHDQIDTDFNRVNNGAAIGGVPPSLQGDVGTSHSNVSGKASLRWQLPDRLMIYGSYARGYKAPAIDNIFATTATRLRTIVPPEIAKAWELGMKSELFDRRMRLGITGFYTTFDNLQGQGTLPGQIGFVLTSAGTVITKGVEFEVTAKPISGLLLNSAISYTDAYFDSYPAAPCFAGQTVGQGCVNSSQNLTGKPLANAPRWKGTLQARYDFGLTPRYNVFLSSNYRYQTQSQGDQNQDVRLIRQAYGILDLTVGVAEPGGRWEVAVFAKNALNRFYEDLRVIDTTNDAQGVNHYLTRDAWRYVGAEIQYRFGAN